MLSDGQRSWIIFIGSVLVVAIVGFAIYGGFKIIDYNIEHIHPIHKHVHEHKAHTHDHKHPQHKHPHPIPTHTHVHNHQVKSEVTVLEAK